MLSGMDACNNDLVVSMLVSPLVFRSGLELKENIFVDGEWWIERCPHNSIV
jgi:hypothetical protein